jgi:hypothetical protein
MDVNEHKRLSNITLGHKIITNLSLINQIHILYYSVYEHIRTVEDRDLINVQGYLYLVLNSFSKKGYGCK